MDKYLTVLPFSDVSFVISSVLLNTLMASAFASFNVVSPSLYSCFKLDTAAFNTKKLKL